MEAQSEKDRQLGRINAFLSVRNVATGLLFAELHLDEPKDNWTNVQTHQATVQIHPSIHLSDRLIHAGSWRAGVCLVFLHWETLGEQDSDP